MLRRRWLVYPQGMAEYGWVILAVGLTLGGGFLTYALARRGRSWAALITCLLILLVGVALLIAAESATGWDGLGYFLVVMLFVAPSFVGASFGAVLGVVIARRARSRAASIDDAG